MGRLSRIHLVPLATGIVILACALLLRPEGRNPRRTARPRSSAVPAPTSSAALVPRDAATSHPSSDSRWDEVEEAERSCTAIYEVGRVASAWEAAAFYDAASADLNEASRIGFAREWDPLTSETLEKDLELTPAQKARIDDLRVRFEVEEELWRSHSLLESEVDRKLDELQDRYRSLIRRELSPEQQRKYDELEAGTLRGAVAALERLAEIPESTDP